MINNRLLVVRPKRLGCLPVAFAVGIIVTIIVTVNSSRRVVLNAPPTSNVVQMFSTVAADSSVARQFPDGTTCTRIDGPLDFNVAGSSMAFYHLECEGIIGYVNARWVR